MRRAAAIASVLVVLALSTAYAGYPGFPRHVDPLSVPERTNILDVVNLLARAGELLARLEVGSAKNLTELLTTAPVPQAVREVYARFTGLLSTYADYLNRSLTYLNLAEEALSRGELAVCKEALREVEGALSKARATYVILQDAYTYFTRPLSPPLTAQVGRVLDNAAKALDEVSRRYRELDARFTEALSRGLTEVLVEAYVNATRVLYGDLVEVWGRVVDAQGRPLVGRRVTVSYSTLSWSAVTGREGSFRLVVPIYSCGGLTVVVAYTPLGGDTYVYRYSEARLSVSSLCRVPVLKLTVPEVVYVGTLATICVESDVSDLEVSVSIVGTNASASLRVSGPTCTGITIPGSTGEGLYRVVAVSKPARGVPPARAEAYVRVARVPVGVDLSYPRLLLTGFPAEVCAYPDVPSEIAVTYPTRAGPPATGTANCVSVEVPATYLEVELPVSIYVKPLNSTYREVLLELRLTVVNVHLLALTVAAVALLVALYREGATYRGPGAAGALLPETPTVRVAEVSPLVAEFVEAVRAVSGVELEGSMTLREYVGRVLSVVGGSLRELLGRCLAIVERVVYGPQVGVEDLVRELRELLRTLRRGTGPWLYVVSGLVASLATLSVLVYLVPSTDDLSPYNPLWNGLSRMVSEFNASAVSVGAIASLNPRSSAILVIGTSGWTDGPSAELLRDFVEAGGVLVIADEDPRTNNLLRSLGLEAALGGAVVADTVFMHRDPRLPLARARTPSANLTLYLNYATYVNTTRVDRCVAWTFPTSFLDLNLSGSREGYEPYGPFCIAYREDVGGGVVYLISDSSLFINSMVGLGGNLEFARAIVGTRSVYVLYGGGVSPYSRFRELLLGTYSKLFRTWLKYPAALALALVFYKLLTHLRRGSTELILPKLPHSSMKELERLLKELGELGVDEG